MILRPCDWKNAPFAKLQALPRDGKPVTRWDDRDEAFLDVTSGIRTAVQELRAHPLSGSSPRATRAASRGPVPASRPVWNVPHSQNFDFTGREELLTYLRAALTSGESAALTQAISGLGGVGKTQLAVEYVYRHRGSYDVVWWLAAESPATLAVDYAALAAALGLADALADQETAIRAVCTWLGRESHWLLIFDNAPGPDSVRPYLPLSMTGHVLVTSRNPNWGGLARRLTVLVLAEQEAEQFVLKRTGRTDLPAARDLTQALGGLPLALEQAASYIEASGCTIRDYVELFRENQLALFRDSAAPPGYPSGVLTTWALALQRVEAESPAGVDLLRLAAFLAPDDVPLDLVRLGAEHLSEPLQTAAAGPLVLERAMMVLRRYSLVERTGDSLSVHRLVQAVTRDGLTAEDRGAWAERAVRVMEEVFPSDSADHRSWAACARLLAHALATADHAEALDVAPDATAYLLNRLGRYARARAVFQEARAHLERALRIDEQSYGSDHPTVATVVSNLGSVLQALGDLAGARAHLDRALRIDEQAHGPDHPTVATVVSNLGSVLQEQGDLAGARAHFERALRITQQAYGPEHPRAVSIRSALAALGI